MADVFITVPVTIKGTVTVTKFTRLKPRAVTVDAPLVSSSYSLDVPVSDEAAARLRDMVGRFFLHEDRITMDLVDLPSFDEAWVLARAATQCTARAGCSGRPTFRVVHRHAEGDGSWDAYCEQCCRRHRAWMRRIGRP